MSPKLAEAPKLPKMELIPPRTAEVEGVFRQPGSPHDGRIIYTDVEIDIAATKATARTKLDAEGKEIWKKTPGGEPLYPILEKDIVMKPVRYILHPQEVGRNVKKVYNFEMTEDEKRAIAEKENERNFTREFFKAAAESGLSPAQIIAKLKADTLNDGESPDQVELTVTEEVVAETLAELDDELMQIDRPADEENIGAVDEERADE